MKVTKWSSLVEEFDGWWSVVEKEDKKKIPQVTREGVIIHVVQTMNEGPLRIMIDVSEDTTSDNLRKAIPLALKWRDRLIEFQGKTGLWSPNYLLKIFCRDLGLDRKSKVPTQFKQGRFTYEEVAEAVNQIVYDLLYKHNGEEIPYYKPASYRKILDMYILDHPDPLEGAKELLRICRFKEKDIQEFLRHGFEDIRQRHPPFEKDYPLSGDKLEEILKTYRGYWKMDRNPI